MSYDALYERYGQKYGVDPRILKAFAQKESTEQPGQITGSHAGLFQLSPAEWRRWGHGNILDPEANAEAAAAKLAYESHGFANLHGRTPTADELYLIHQQGPGGAAAHAANPQAPAWRNMLATGEGQQRGSGWARQAIWDNMTPAQKQQYGSVDNVSSGDFMAMQHLDTPQNQNALMPVPAEAYLRQPSQTRSSGDASSEIATLQPYIHGGSGRLDHLQPSFRSGLVSALNDMPENLRGTVRITSDYRDPEDQHQILLRHGVPNTPEAMARGIPGVVAGVDLDANGNAVNSHSMHARGAAVDIDASDDARRWLYANSARYGFENPASLRSSDPVHFQLLNLGDVPAGNALALYQPQGRQGDYVQPYFRNGGQPRDQPSMLQDLIWNRYNHLFDPIWNADPFRGNSIASAPGALQAAQAAPQPNNNSLYPTLIPPISAHMPAPLPSV